ncbi:MAG TPA: hypothetical protein VFL54_07830, partial [Gammaproteobacteria bacterium]|nr:hypothetical protein [Gammaproteobacteria bacterium]
MIIVMRRLLAKYIMTRGRTKIQRGRAENTPVWSGPFPRIKTQNSPALGRAVRDRMACSYAYSSSATTSLVAGSTK